MRFFKHVLLPLLIITATTLVAIINPTWKISLIPYISIISLIFGTSMFSFYYIFSFMFPDNRNPNTLPIFSSLNKKNLEQASKTLASKLSMIFTFLFICFGFYLWWILPEKYLNHYLTSDSKSTIGVVISTRQWRGEFGERKIYTFSTNSGIEYKDYVINDNLQIGDSVNVYYSEENPVNHKVWKR